MLQNMWAQMKGLIWLIFKKGSYIKVDQKIVNFRDSECKKPFFIVFINNISRTV